MLTRTLAFLAVVIIAGLLGSWIMVGSAAAITKVLLVLFLCGLLAGVVISLLARRRLQAT